MNTQRFQGIVIAVVLVITIGGIMLWMSHSYQRMQAECDKMGGRFYSISFSQNICVDGDVVHQLK